MFIIPFPTAILFCPCIKVYGYDNANNGENHRYDNANKWEIQ